MFMTRALRRLVCQGLIGLTLFTQLAVASYACPAWAPLDGPAPATEMGTVMMVDCDQMAGELDKASANLCAGHCHYGQQSDQVHAAALPPVALVSLYSVAATLPEARQDMSATAASVAAPPAPSPPHAILHCCIRV